MSDESNAEEKTADALYISEVKKNRKSQPVKFVVSAIPKPPTLLMPTYRMEPMRPLNKDACENIIKNVMDNTFEGFTYFPKSSLQLCAEVSEEIKTRIKNQNYDRYRYIVVVSVGEKLMQGLLSLVNFLWDAEKDGYLSYAIDTPTFFATATLYYIYYD